MRAGPKCVARRSGRTGTTRVSKVYQNKLKGQIPYLLTHDIARGRRRGGRRRRGGGGGGRGWCRGHDDNSKSGLVGSARTLLALPSTRSTLSSNVNDLTIRSHLP